MRYSFDYKASFTFTSISHFNSKEIKTAVVAQTLSWYIWFMLGLKPKQCIQVLVAKFQSRTSLLRLHFSTAKFNLWRMYLNIYMCIFFYQTWFDPFCYRISGQGTGTLLGSEPFELELYRAGTGKAEISTISKDYQPYALCESP